MARLIAVAALAVLLAGCGSTQPKRGLSFRVDKSPFQISIVQDGKTVVREDKDARLRYVLASGAEHKLTKVISSAADGRYTVATDEPGRTAQVTVSPIRAGFAIEVELKPAAGVAQIFDSFDTGPNDHFLGGGEQRGQVDLRGAIEPVKVSTGCGYAPMPFFASSAGWGLQVDSGRAALAFPGSPGGAGCQFGSDPACTFPALADRAEVCARAATLSERLYVGSIPKTLAAAVRAVGGVRVPPPSELAVIKWRDAVTGPGQVLEDITRFQAAGIPLGWVLVDNPWETCVGSLTFNPKQFPDPAGLIRQVHAKGVRFMLWVSPKILCNPGYPAKALLGNPAEQVELDLSNAAVRTAFEAKLRKLVALGVDGVKADRGDEVDLESLGKDQNRYVVEYAELVMRSLPKNAAAIFRAATAGSQNVIPGLWAGDQDESFDGLQQAILSGQSASISGFPTWGSDVGGYRLADESPELFARWAQFGAVSPIMEIGGEGANATPWTMGPAAMSALKDAAILHYELFPYMDGLLQRGQPVLRPLAYAYPNDPEAWASDLEVLVGPDLLAAPVIGPGETPSVYLPAGTWIDLFTGLTVAGGGPSFTRPTPDSQFPLYVRSGSVLPFNLRTATDSWWGTNEQTHPGRAGWLATAGATLDLKGQPSDVQLFIPAATRPGHVTIGGHAVAWTWNAGPLPGVVVRVHGPRIQGEIALSP